MRKMKLREARWKRWIKKIIINFTFLLSDDFMVLVFVKKFGAAEEFGRVR